MITDKELNIMQMRAASATPGPWRCDAENNYGWAVLNDVSVWIEKDGESKILFNIGGCITEVDHNEQGFFDGTFLAHAREDVPNLIRTVRKMKDRLGMIDYYATGKCNDPDEQSSLWKEMSDKERFEAIIEEVKRCLGDEYEDKK